MISKLCCNVLWANGIMDAMMHIVMNNEMGCHIASMLPSIISWGLACMKHWMHVKYCNGYATRVFCGQRNLSRGGFVVLGTWRLVNEPMLHLSVTEATSTNQGPLD